jgi:putative redox protein
MSTSKAYVKQIDGIAFAGKTESNHWVPMDGPEQFGGSNAGIRPKELLLLSLAGCTGSDVVSILEKKRINLQDFEMNVSAEMTDEHPKVYTEINMEFVLYGKDIKPKDVERAIELSSTTYCGVTKMLEKSVNIKTTYRIVEV